MKNNYSSTSNSSIKNIGTTFKMLLRVKMILVAIMFFALTGFNNLFAQIATIFSPTPSVAAANVCAGSIKVPIYYFTIALDATPTNFTGFNFATTGTYAVADLNVFKLWYNTVNDLSLAVQVGVNLTPAVAGTQTFAAFTRGLTISATSYFWVTMDVAALPTADRTIAVSAITTSNITTSSGTVAGTASAGDIQTLKVSIANNTVSTAQIICTGNTPSALSGSVPIGSGGSYAYLWESSTTSSTTGFSSAPGTNTTIGYIPGALTSTTWYRRTVTSGPCAVDVSSAIEITVNPTIASNTVNTAQPICTGSTPTALTGSAPTGGNGSYTYLWESSTTSSTTGFAAAAGTNTTVGYIPGALTTTTWYRRTVTSGPCTANVSAAIGITVNPVIASNTVGTAQIICSGSTPTALSGSVPTGGNGTYTYLWESSTTSSTTGFASALGTNNTVGYIPGALTTTTWYRRTVISGPCTASISTAIEITVNPIIASNTVGTAQTICTGSTPTALTGSVPTGGNGSYIYLWEFSTTSSTTGFSSASGTNNASGYIPGALSTTTWYRRTVASGPCTANVSTVIQITVNPIIANNTVNTAQTICTGSTPTALTGSVPTGGNGSYTYLWESSTTSSTTGFTSATGTNTTIGYIPGVLTATTWYRRTVTSGPCPADVSAAIEVTVNPIISSNTVSTAQTICTGSTPTALSGSTPSGGNGFYTYLWESSTTSSTTGFSSASGTNTTIGYIPGALTISTWYRRTVTSVPCSANVSTAIGITVNPIIASNTVGAAQPICIGNTPAALTGSVPTGGNGSYTYLWESSTTSSTIGFSSASGVNTTVGYIPGVLTTTTWFRRTVTSGPCAASVSAAIEITINPVISGNTVLTAQTICSGAIPAALTGSIPTGGNGSYIYLWESSTTSSTVGFSAASGTNSTIGYIPGALITTTWYRRTVISGPCTDVSLTIEITVNPGINNNAVSAAQTICTGGMPAALTGSSPLGGNGSYTYLWESSTISSTAGFAAASGTNSSIGYIPGALTITTWYRRTATSGPCIDVSAAIEITVNPIIANNTLSSAQIICRGDVPSSLTGSTPTGGNGSYTYLWESSTTSSSAGFASASGTNTSIGYSPGSLTATTWYRRTVTSGPCADDVSSAIEITINPSIISNTLSAAQTICSGAVPAILTGSLPSGGNGSYTYLWESSTTSNVSGFVTATGTNNTGSYAPAALTTTMWFRRTVTSGPCFNLSLAIQITVNPGIAGNTINSAQTICTGTTPTALTGSAPAGGNSSYTYLWESSTTSSTTGFSPATGTNSSSGYIPGTLTSTTWYRRNVSSGPCADVSTPIEITLNQRPLITVSNSSQTICSGFVFTTMALSTSNSIANTTFAWTRNNGTISTGGVTGIAASGSGDITGVALTNTTSSPITVTFTITPTGPASTYCLGAAATATIIVNPTPTLSSNLSPPAICSGTIFSYTPSSTTTGATFAWTRAAVAGISNLASNGNSNPNETLTSTSSNPINVTYLYTVSANSCTNTANYSVVIVVNPTPLLSSSLTPPAICSGTAFNYSPTSTTTGTLFAWTRAVVTGISNSAGNGTNSVSETLNNITTSPVNVTYSFTLTANSCTNTPVPGVTVVVNPLPRDPHFTPYATTVCSGSKYVSFTLDSIQNNVYFSWSGTNATLATSWGGTPNAEFNFGTVSPAVITLQVTNITTGCINIHTETINVSGNQAPVPPPISIINTNWLVCQLNGSGITYQWGFDSLPTLTSRAIPGAVFQQYNALDYPSNTKQYWVIVKEGGCFTKSFLNELFLNIDAPMNDQWINLFPNPAGNSLSLSSSENIIAIQVFEISGRLAIEKRIFSPQKLLTIDVKEMRNGIYLVGLETTEHHKLFKKLIIQH